MLKLFLIKTHLVHDFLGNVVLNIRRDIIVDLSIQLHAVFGFGPHALMNTIVNNTSYEGGLDSEPADITSRHDSISIRGTM